MQAGNQETQEDADAAQQYLRPDNQQRSEIADIQPGPQPANGPPGQESTQHSVGT